MLYGFAYAQAPCRCFGPQPEGCVCGDDERVLRAYAGGMETMPPMDATQRGSCIVEAVRCHEGSQRAAFATLSDQDLARAVLHGWVEFCRDKGLP
jgi:hypothetical protein